MSTSSRKLAATASGSHRVIVHLDLDCFYAQVEQRRLGIPVDQPVAVQQWGSLLAVNYVARAAGVLRGEHTSEALKKCPSIHLPHVDTLGENRRPNEVFDRKHQKAILRRYRLASREIFAVLTRLAPMCEKAGIDEAFLDLTQQAQERLTQMEVVSSDFCTDVATQTTKVFGISQMDGVGKDAERDTLSGFPLTEQEQLLVAGAMIADEIREAIRQELQYTCSTGIAGNKLLAKLASPLNKPDGQTLIAPRFVPLLLQHFPLRKVPGLGGKLGKQLEGILVERVAPSVAVASTLTLGPGDRRADSNSPLPALRNKDERTHKVTVAEFMAAFRFEELVQVLGYDAAAFVRQACSGEDGNEPVNEKKTEVKAFSAVKQFDQRSGDALVRVEQLAYWVRVLSEEMILRCEDERVESKRFPLQLLFHSTRVGGKPQARKLRIAQTTTVDELVEATMTMLRRDLPGVFPCAAISMHAKDFMALDSTNATSISHFFVVQPPPPSQSPAESADADDRDPFQQVSLPVQRQAERASAVPSSKRAKISAFFQSPRLSAARDGNGADDGVVGPTRQSRSPSAASEATESASSGAEVAQLDSVAQPTEGGESSEFKLTETEDTFAQFRTAASSEKTTSSDADARPSFYCDRCLRAISESRAEHADFHFAVDLSRAERSELRVQQAASASALGATTGLGGRSGAVGGKKRKSGPLDAFLKR